MQSIVISAGLLAWWGCACRIGRMQRGTHRWGAMLWHWVLAVASLAATAGALIPSLQQLGLAVAASVGAYLLATLPQWSGGAVPAWASVRR